jgi:hypothetical protein
MAGLVPAIHVFATARKKDVDARPKAGHDENGRGTMAVEFPLTLVDTPPHRPTLALFRGELR